MIQSNGGGISTTFTTIFGSVSSPALSTKYINTGLTSGQTYTYRYYAVNRQGDGIMSDETQIIAATVPGAPAQPTVTYSSLLYTVTWTQPTTGGTGIAITNYRESKLKLILPYFIYYGDQIYNLFARWKNI